MVADLESVEARAALADVAVQAGAVIQGEAGSAIAQALGREAGTLEELLDTGRVLDDLGERARAIVEEAIGDLTLIAAECLRELSTLLPVAVATPGAAAPALLGAALPHWEDAEARYQEMEAELTDLTAETKQVEVAQPEATATPGAVTAEAETDVEPTPGTPSPPAQKAVAAAKSALGTPYQWGGTTPGQGLDCSGLTQWAYAQAGIDIPRTADAQAVGPQIPRDQVQPGDLAVWDGHVAMVVEDGRMIEAGDPVQINPIRQDNLGMAFKGFYRPSAA